MKDHRDKSHSVKETDSQLCYIGLSLRRASRKRHKSKNNIKRKVWHSGEIGLLLFAFFADSAS